jgi:hypothetical protein
MGFPMLGPYKHLDNRRHVYYSNSNLSTCTNHLPRSNYHRCLTNRVYSYWLHHHQGRSKSIQERDEIAGAKKQRRCQCLWSIKPYCRQKFKTKVLESKYLGTVLICTLVCIYNFITALHHRIKLRQATATFAAFGNWEIADAVLTARGIRLKRFRICR